MSTLQTTTQSGNTTSPRPGAKVLGLISLAAVGLALLILVPTNQRATVPKTDSIAHEVALPAQALAPAGCFRDPVTHAVACARTAGSLVATPAVAASFRDPVTHELLRLTIPRHRAGQRPANHSRGRIIP